MRREPHLTGKPRLFYDWMPQGADSLLDIGCAYSFMLNLLGGKSKKRFGLDFDLEKIIEAKSRFGDIHYISGLGENMPFKDNSLDVVTFFEVLEHVRDEREFIRQIHRIVKPGGIIMLSVPNKGAAECIDIDNIFFTPTLSVFKKLGFFKNVDTYYLQWHRHYSRAGLEKLFAPFFTVQKVYYGGLFANQLGFLIYKSLYLALLLLKINKNNCLFKILHSWMDKITSWDFEHSFGTISDKLCIYAVKTK